MRIFFLTIFLLISTSAQARDFRFVVSATALRAEVNDPRYDVKNKISTGFNYGIAKNYKNILLSLTTNRLVNYPTRTTVVKNNLHLENKTRSVFDTVSLNYKFNKFSTGLFISNAKVKKSLWRNKKFLASEEKNVILYGLNETFFLSRNSSLSVLLTAPNRELYLKGAVILSLNYYF